MKFLQYSFLLFAICPFACELFPNTQDNSSETKPECNGIPPVRTESESCCKAYGADACGATLFCENFDGREISTCYPLHSRLGREQCSADEHCVSGVCNLDTGLCKSVYMEKCDVGTGCNEHYRCRNACPGFNSDCDSSCTVDCEYHCIS